MLNKIALRKKKRRAMIFLFFIIFLIVFFNFKIRPVIKSSASNKSRVIVSQTINESILKDMYENRENYSEIMAMNKNDTGEVVSFTSNIEKINSLKSHVALTVGKALCNLKEKDTLIPLGTLSGIEFLNCKGPPIPLKISTSGNVYTDLKSDFWASGINQTLHRINLIIHTKVSVIMPGCSCSFETDNKVLIAETVILGRVPNLYGGTVTNSMAGSESGEQ